MRAMTTECFTYDRDARKLVTEASTVTFSGEEEIVLVSHRTGRRVPFSFRDAVFDADGDVTLWRFWNSELRLSVEIYND